MQTAETLAAAERDAEARYQADGFLVVPDILLPADLVRRASQGMDALRRGEYDTGHPPCPSAWKPGDDPNRLCKIEQPQFANTAIRELVSHPALGQIAATITGATMVQAWWVQLLYKPPSSGNRGTNVGWHQDRSYWGQWEPGSELFTAWVALSDVQEDCGPMRFVRGSHRWGLLGQGDFFEQDIAGQRSGIMIPAGKQWEEVPALLPPGGASFHDNLTFHGSGPNHSGRARRSFAIHLRTQNSRPVGDERQGLTEFIDDTTLCPVLYAHS